MKKILLFLLSITLLSCYDKRIENRVSALEKRFNFTNDSIKLFNYQRGLLYENDKIKDNDNDRNGYWDIPTDNGQDQKGIPFAYHRKNESELWQPINGVYFSDKYVRIPSSYGEMDNEQYLIVIINYDNKKKKIVYE